MCIALRNTSDHSIGVITYTVNVCSYMATMYIYAMHNQQQNTFSTFVANLLPMNDSYVLVRYNHPTLISQTNVY